MLSSQATRFSSWFIIISVFYSGCLGSNILLINPHYMYSHSVLFGTFVEALVPRNHNVTLITSLPYKGPMAENITQHLLHNEIVANKIAEKEKWQNLPLIARILPSSEIFTVIMQLFGEEGCKYLENQFLMDIMITNATYDVILVNGIFSECFLTIADKKNIPAILLVPSITLPWHNTILGIQNKYGIDLSFFLKYPKPDLLSRMEDIFQGNLIYWYRNWVFGRGIEKWNTKGYSHVKIPPLPKLESTVSMIMTNTISAMGLIKTTVPRLIEIGGMHCRRPRKLPKHIDEFIAGAGKHGFVYVSFGSFIRSYGVPKDVISALLNVFGRLHQRVIWKWDADIPNVPSNVMVLKWVPQQDILGDPRVRVFINQGGMFSQQEAAFHGVPVLVIPFVLDQRVNKELAKEQGFGLELDLMSITPDTLMGKVQTILSENRFKIAAQRMSQTIRDNPETPTERATWWIEYVIRNKGAPFLQISTREISWYQHNQLDITFILFIILILVIFSFVYITKKIYGIFYKRDKIKQF